MQKEKKHEKEIIEEDVGIQKKPKNSTNQKSSSLK